MARKRLTDHQRAAILDDLRDGLGRNEIARKHQVSASTITGIAVDNGVEFDRSATKKATEAAQADASSRRTHIVQRLYAVADRTLNDLDSGNLVGAQSKRELITVVGIALDKASQLEKVDADRDGLSAVDAWLRDVMGGGE